MLFSVNFVIESFVNVYIRLEKDILVWGDTS